MRSSRHYDRSFPSEIGETNHKNAAEETRNVARPIKAFSNGSISSAVE